MTEGGRNIYIYIEREREIWREKEGGRWKKRGRERERKKRDKLHKVYIRKLDKSANFP